VLSQCTWSRKKPWEKRDGTFSARKNGGVSCFPPCFFLQKKWDFTGKKKSLFLTGKNMGIRAAKIDGSHSFKRCKASECLPKGNM
jgi:hypothetical protein